MYHQLHVSEDVVETNGSCFMKNTEAAINNNSQNQLNYDGFFRCIFIVILLARSPRTV